MNDNENVRPLVRNLDAVPDEQNGDKMIAVQDPLGYSDRVISLTHLAFYLVTLMDGENDIDALRTEVESKFDTKVSEQDVLTIVNALDEALMLDNKRFSDHKEKLKEEFLAQEYRACHHIGVSYPDDPVELDDVVSNLLENRNGGGGKPASAVVLPHIDFRVGGDMMAQGWSELKNSDAELFIILGTGHSLADDFFACLDKDFKTPLGVMPVDSSFLEKLGDNFGEGLYGEAEAHRTEHSIEFQALFFAKLFRDRKDVKAVPILLSFPENIWEMDHPVFNGGRVEKFMEALGKTVRESGKKVAFIASVDFSHIGVRFGDSIELDNKELSRIEADDRAMIDAIEEMDKEKFMKVSSGIASSNRVCGFPPLYAMLNVCGAEGGSLMEYRQNIEGENESVVSFATMRFDGAGK